MHEMRQLLLDGIGDIVSADALAVIADKCAALQQLALTFSPGPGLSASSR